MTEEIIWFGGGKLEKNKEFKSQHSSEPTSILNESTKKDLIKFSKSA